MSEETVSSKDNLEKAMSVMQSIIEHGRGPIMGQRVPTERPTLWCTTWKIGSEEAKCMLTIPNESVKEVHGQFDPPPGPPDKAFLEHVLAYVKNGMVTAEITYPGELWPFDESKPPNG